MTPIRLLRPVPNNFRISSKFGLRVINGKEEFHKGVDFAVPVGTPVVAVVEGSVHRAGWENALDPHQGFGMRVMQLASLDGKAFWIFYGHLSKLVVEEDDKVIPGMLIGYSGNTGRTTGPHLHMGCRQSDTNEWFDMDFTDKPVAPKDVV